MKELITVATGLLLCSGITACNSSDNMDSKIDEIYNNMTEGERVAQLCAIYLNDFFLPDGTLDTAKCREVIPDGIGHFSQYASQLSWEPDQTRDRVAIMQDWLIYNTPSGIPALFHEEALTGVCTRGATVYPQQIGQACSFNTELAQLKTAQTGAALRSIGGMLALSPMVDVVRTPSFNRLEESYGEDAYLSAALGTAFVKGLQQGDLRKGIGACSKHFLGYGGGGDAPEKELMEEILLPHEAMIREGGSTVVMTGYHSVHGTDCVASSELQEDILRSYLGFKGMMVSDYGSINQIRAYDNNLQRGAAALNAGNDVDFPSGESYKLLPQALADGLVDKSTLEKAVKRVLAYKASVGLLDENPQLYSEGHIEFDTPAERQTAYDIASQSVVLLKNDGALPLASNAKVLLTGPNANTMWAMLGDYTFHSMRFFWQQKIEDELHPLIVTLKDGMEARKPASSQLAYTRGCNWTETVETVIEEGGDQRAEYMRSIQGRMVQHPETADEAEALAMAASADVIVAAVGENVILCGENRDRTSLRLPGSQEEFVRKLVATGKPVVLVMFGGRAQVISELADQCAAVVQAWYPGEEGGNAVADILYGNICPSGKLSVGYPDVEIHEPVCYNRSLEKDARIRWEFGYGLSYTSFAYSDLSLDSGSEISTDSEAIDLSFTLANTGTVAGEEIVQLYLSPAQEGLNIRPIQLHGFKRVALTPGETARVSFRLPLDQFGFYADRNWHVAPGRYTIKIAASSQDIRLQQDVVLMGSELVKSLRDNYFTE